MLADEELRAIFKFIYESAENAQKRSLENERKGKKTWKYWASTVLESRYSLVEDSMPERNSTRSYEITERGRVVMNTLQRIQNTEYIAADHSTDEAYRWSLHLLRHFHGAEEWGTPNRDDDPYV